MANHNKDSDPRYHNTVLLLKRYRDVVWSVELEAQQLRNSLRLEYGTDLDQLLESAYIAGFDFLGTDIEGRARSLERSRKMLEIIDKAVQLLRTKHKHGESFYWILYYTYLSPQELESVDAILMALEPHVKAVTDSTYFRRRKDAIIALSTVLWGFTTPDCLDIVDLFLPDTAEA